METIYKSIEAKFLAADEHLEYGDIREAKDMLEEILLDDPTYGRAHNHLGWIYLIKLDDFKRAECHLKMAMRYAPRYPGGYRNYAHFLYTVGRYDDLLAHVAKTSKIAGMDKANMLRFVGLTHEAKGNFKDAKKVFTETRDQAINEEFLNLASEDLKRIKRKMGWLKWLLS